MAILRFAASSPFVRKCTISIALLGLENEITIQPADTSDPNEALRTQNPLGKIPTLVLEDGETLFDSRVILAYLDQRAGGGKLYPTDPNQRMQVLRLEALADGIMDAAIAQVYEVRFREEAQRSQMWLDRQAEKVARALTHLESNVPSATAPPTAGTIALVCALGYLDLRFEGKWRADYPALVAWHEKVSSSDPAFAATAPNA